MAYEVALSVRVPAMGAEWVFGPADKAEARYTAWGIKLARQQTELVARRQAGEELDATDLIGIPPELAEEFCVIACDWFVEGCCGWDGVMHNGQELPYTRETVKQIPHEAKTSAISELIKLRVEAEGNASAPDETPTEQPPPE